VTPSLSLSFHKKKNSKIRKIKFGTKINFIKIKGTDYLIAKNYREVK
jgi:hypothetical protein